MKNKPEKIPLPGLGAITAAIDGDTPPHELLVQFFKQWWAMKTPPYAGEYRLLYIALSKLLPQVIKQGWPKEEFKYWVNHEDSALITRYSTFKRLYLDMFGPFFDAVEFVRKFEEGGDVEGYIIGCRQAQKAATEEKVTAAQEDNPDATQQQIAEVVGVSQVRVSQVKSEIKAKSEPKLLKHGGNMAEQGDYRHVDRGSNKADYILARLKRDGRSELAEQVKAGMLSARKAGIQAGIVKPESQLTVVKRAWKKLNESERQEFLSWIETTGATQHGL